MSAVVASWWREVTSAGPALVVGTIACLVLGATGVPDRVAGAWYRWAAAGRGDGVVLAPDEVAQPVMALWCLRIFEAGTSLLINMLVLLGTLSWLR